MTLLFAKLDESTEKNHGWLSIVMLEIRGKILATIKLHGIAGASYKRENSCKDENERKYGKVKRAKDMRTEIFQEF